MAAHVNTFFEGHPISHREWPTGPVRRRVPHFDVYEIGPGPRLNLWSYVTSGCWESTAHNEHGLEFVLSATERNSRHLEILTMLAYYHAGPTQQRLDDGHTLPIGDPWTQQSMCTHLLSRSPTSTVPNLRSARGRTATLASSPFSRSPRPSTTSKSTTDSSSQVSVHPEHR